MPRSCWRPAVGSTVLLALLAALALPHPTLPSPAPCTPPILDPQRFPDTCTILKRTCVLQQTFVTFDEELSLQPLPELPFIRWNFPSGVVNTDAIHGGQPWYTPLLRRATLMEPDELSAPVFSACTTPLVLLSDWAFNVGEFLAEMVTMVHKAVHELGMDRNLTLAYTTPEGLALTPYHRLMLAPYSNRGVTSLGEIGAVGAERGGAAGAGAAGDEAGGGGAAAAAAAGGAVDWSWEGRHVSCFEQVAVCKWMGGRNRRGVPVAVVGAELVRQLTSPAAGGRPLPEDPLGFGGSRDIPGYPGDPPEAARGGGGDSTEGGGAVAAAVAAAVKAGGALPRLRVLIETRHGMARNVRNMEELLAACEAADGQSFTAGHFRGLVCKPFSFSGGGALVGVEHFRANVAGVRSAHVMVVQHGAGAINSFFMRQGKDGPSALLELRACKLGTKYAYWPDGYEPHLHYSSDDAIRFFAMNIEDPDQCMDPDYMALVTNGSMPHGLLSASGATRARDQHVAPDPRDFIKTLRHVGRLMTDREVYRAAREAGRLHAYVRPSALLWGPQGVKDINKFLKQRRAEGKGGGWAEEEEERQAAAAEGRA